MLDSLREEVRQAAANAQWFAGIPGLFLDIDELCDMGADGQFLH